MIADILACPRCDSPLRMVDHLWECDSCGTVARQRRDIIDFLFDTSVIRLANEGRWDLEEDQRIGLQLLEVLDEYTYEDLRERAIRLRVDSDEFVSDPGAQLRTSGLALRAQRRFARRYERVAGEVGRGHGHQMLHKIETRLQDLKKSPMPRQLAVEVGGGDGQYLLGFATRFQHVVFVDGSLVNVVLATALGRDDGVTNVTFLRADITTLPIRSSVASLVHANNVIEHVHRPYEMTSECVRVTSGGGYAVVVSPNRNSIFPEPHFRLPLYGLIPRPLRLRLIPFTRGKRSEAGTNPLSLRGLRNTLEKTPPLKGVGRLRCTSRTRVDSPPDSDSSGNRRSLPVTGRSHGRLDGKSGPSSNRALPHRHGEEKQPVTGNCCSPMTPVDWRSPALFRFGERTAGTASTTPPCRPRHRRFASGNRSDSGSATLPTIASNRTTDVS